MLRQRVLSSFVFVPIVFGAFYLGGPYFSALLLALSLLGAHEYRKMMLMGGIDLHVSFVPICAVVALVGYYRPPLFAAALSAGAVTVLSIALVRSGSAPSAMYSLSGEMYIGGLLGSLSILRAGPDGRAWALFTLLVTWATDVGAYFGGSVFGKHKIAPAVSPGKSWEGAASGVAAAALAGAVLARFTPFAPGFGALGGAGLGVLAEFGDLVESSLKRFAKVKDSGQLIPGHGGVLDRFDSLLFAGVGGLLIRTLHRMAFR